MRLLVFGSRTFDQRDVIHGFLDLFAQGLPEGERLYVINGFAPGADRMADEWAGAEEHHAEPVRFAADWQACGLGCPPDGRHHLKVNRAGVEYCPLAGFRRNQRMIDEGQPEQAIGFLDKPLAQSKGSADMYRRLQDHGIQTVLYVAGERP